MVTLLVVTWLWRVTCHHRFRGEAAWVSHAVSACPSIASCGELLGSLGSPWTDATPSTCDVVCALGGALGKMLSEIFGRRSEAATVMPALFATAFHRKGCFRLLSVTTNVAPPANALESAREFESRVPA